MTKLPLFLLPLALAAAPALRMDEAPQTISLSSRELLEARSRLARGDPALAPAFKRLQSEAGALLTLRPASVMDKTGTAVSGSKHDYFSFAPYWWPDPSKADGLPYIRRDGDVNPQSRQGTDHDAVRRTCDAVETLGLAYWFTGDARYAGQAAVLARVWFLDPGTRMSPHLQYAQAIPGINNGRGIGLIEVRYLTSLTDGIALLAGAPAWSDADGRALRTWLGEYYHWLKTSGNGRDEAAAVNNHGSWYDVQAAHLALVLGRREDARKILEAGLVARIARQIEPDGRQTHELARTKSLSYSLFNLEALMRLGRLGEQVGLDWWAFTTPDGRNLRGALRFLAPYVDPKKTWPKEDLVAADRARLLPLLTEALRHSDDASFRELLTKHSTPESKEERWHLVWAPIY